MAEPELTSAGFDSLALGVISFLKNKPGVSHIRFDKRAGATADALNAWELTAKAQAQLSQARRSSTHTPSIKLPSDLRSFYGASDGVVG